MSVFNIITLLGGLAMFLYGMRLMGDSLKESSSGTLKVAMEKLTGSPVRAFLLGVAVTVGIWTTKGIPSCLRCHRNGSMYWPQNSLGKEIRPQVCHGQEYLPS